MKIGEIARAATSFVIVGAISLLVSIARRTAEGMVSGADGEAVILSPADELVFDEMVREVLRDDQSEGESHYI